MLHTTAAFFHYRSAIVFRATLLSLALAATSFSAAAQQPERESPLRGQEWYEAQLSELAEVLGGSHYLRILCAGRGDQRWRDAMRGVIQRERRHEATLVEGFNRGYRNEETRFPSCDASAEQTEAELRARGLRVSQALSARYGDR